MILGFLSNQRFNDIIRLKWSNKILISQSGKLKSKVNQDEQMNKLQNNKN